MPNKNDKTPGNIPGPFYVDSSCIDCDLCRSALPGVFVRNDEVGFSIVARQPDSPDELLLATSAAEDCPSDSIGMDG